jgi:hypothetical protein
MFMSVRSNPLRLLSYETSSSQNRRGFERTLFWRPLAIIMDSVRYSKTEGKVRNGIFSHEAVDTAWYLLLVQKLGQIFFGWRQKKLYISWESSPWNKLMRSGGMWFRHEFRKPNVRTVCSINLVGDRSDQDGQKKRKQTMIYKTLHCKLKIEQRKSGVNSYAPEEHYWHLLCYSFYQPGHRSWMRKGMYCD